MVKRWIHERLWRPTEPNAPVGPGCLRLPLSLLSLLYGGAVSVRNNAYDRDWILPRRLPWPVVSVGGIVAGGIGKTPTVILLAEHLRSLGLRPLVLLRGYGAPAPSDRPVLVEPDEGEAWRRAGDEAVHMARSLTGVPVVAFPDRFAAALWAGSRVGFDTVLLDDGFQHRRLHRDLDLVVLDSQKPLGSGRLLPAGDLREAPSGLSRAHGLVLTRCRGDPGVVAGLPEADLCLRTRWEVWGLRRLTGEPVAMDRIRDERLGAVTAIGRPGRFLDDLAQMGLDVSWSWLLPDHEPLRPADIDRLRREMRSRRLDALVMTEKDAVRWEGRLRNMENAYVAMAGASWLEKSDEIRFGRIAAEKLGR